VSTTLRLLSTIALLGLTACTTMKPTKADRAAGGTTGGQQAAKHFTTTQHRTFEANYLLYLPKGYEADAGKRWPLILFLHGAGERGTDLRKVAVHGPPKVAPTLPDFGFIVASPQCPEGETWSSDLLLALLDEVMRDCRVDPRRVYLTGLSMGGYGTWDLGIAHPERFAAIAPICGGGQTINVLLPSPEKAQALKTLGVWAFHGGKDPIVPLEESQRMVEALKRAGVPDVKLTVYPEAGHDSWTETYNNPEFYQWLLAHKR
jgi:predicted peptidase